MGVTAVWKVIWPGEGWPEPAAAGAARREVARATPDKRTLDGPAHDRPAVLRFVPNMASASRFLALSWSWGPRGAPLEALGCSRKAHPRKSCPRLLPAAVRANQAATRGRRTP